ncbi:MAG: hypothetical protein R2789_11570 [Microthrixaceae bacterium]
MEPVDQVLGELQSHVHGRSRPSDSYVHGVDEIGLQELPNGGDTTLSRTSLPSAASVACCNASAGVHEEVAKRGVGQREAGSVMVGENEHGGCGRAGVSPPALPVEVLEPALGRTVTSDLGTDVPPEIAVK